MRLCEVRGCTGAAVGLVRVKLPGWRVAEPRRVCARHHRELAPEEGPKETKVATTKTKCGAVGKCSMCSEEKRIKARNMCDSCYTLDLQQRKLQAEVAKRGGTTQVPQGPEKSRAEMEKLREQLAQARSDVTASKLAHQGAEKRLAEVLAELSSVTKERDNALEGAALAKEDNAAERQAWASLVVELDEMATPETVEGLSEAELRVMLRRWKESRDQLRGAATALLEEELAASKAKVAALEKQLHQEHARSAGLEDERHDMRDDIAVAATLLRLAQEEMEDMHNRSARIVGIMLGSALDALEGTR